VTDRIAISGNAIDLSSRVIVRTVVAGSPATNEEHVIATTFAVDAAAALAKTTVILAWAAFTVGTSGTAARLRVRQTDVNGSVVADSGATTAGVSATALMTLDCAGADASPATPAIWCMTLQITGGAAVSTVSAVQLLCLFI